MTIAFTLCSVNYFAQAFTLGKSLQESNPDIKYIIGLVDKLSTKTIDLSLIPDFELLEVDKIEIQDFTELCNRYDITELNTAVKPYYIKFLYEKYPTAKNVIYFDPDIIVFQPLTELLTDLEKYNLVLTPHITTPYNDDKWQNEEDVVNTGVYNLGFIATSRSDETLKFVKWWMDKLSDGAYIDLCNGLFTDQHWVEFAPALFEGVMINKYLGYNVAYWNLHERFISKKGNTWLINNEFPIRFFHYSGYSPFKPDVVSKYQNRINFSERPDIVQIFDLYKESLLNNSQKYWQDFKCDYVKPPKVKRFVRVRKYLKLPFEKIANWIES
ncbi:MAG: glycosyltransferase [Spirosomataceae bacterium]